MVYNICNDIKVRYFDEVKDLSAPERQSALFRHFLEDIPIFFREEDLIAGWHGWEDDQAPQLNTQSVPSFAEYVSWTSEEAELRQGLHQLAIEIRFNPAHTCLDYQTVIEKGLQFYLNKVDTVNEKNGESAIRKAMKSSLEAVITFAERFAQLALTQAQETANEERKQRLLTVHHALCQVPRYPARNFLEAVQAIWIMHAVIPVAENSWASLSLGRMDQYLYPFYRKAMADGWSETYIKDILKNLFLLLDNYADGACALNLGGMDLQGNDQMNELSGIVIQVEKEMLRRSPILVIRTNPRTPADILDSVIDYELFKIGQPSFYGEIPCRKAVMGRGIPENEAAGFSVNSCMGLHMVGQEFSDMWGIKFYSHLPLELALNGGKPIHGEIPFTLKTKPTPVSNREELLRQYGLYFDELIEKSAFLYRRIEAAWHGTNRPDPLLSAMLEGCVESGKDRAVGAKYNAVTVETMGLVNTCNAIQAVCELVFEKKQYTVDEMIQAVRDNYVGYDQLRRDIRNCRQYGMNEAEPNEIIRQLSDLIADACDAQRYENFLFLPSLHTIGGNVDFGRKLHATLDGRLSGEPVNKNANPSNDIRKMEHTSLVLSAACVHQERYSGGQPIDAYFDKSWFEVPEKREQIKQLILTYFDLGGLQFQVNSIDLALLEKAHENPEEYPYIIVRLGGYSAYFTQMSRESRCEFLNHLKKGS